MPHSDQSVNPDGGDASARMTIQPALDQNLMAQVLEPDNMKRAWKRVKSNQGTPGIDEMTLEDWRKNVGCSLCLRPSHSASHPPSAHPHL
jgi:RNA-directed DNA polymerase